MFSSLSRIFTHLRSARDLAPAHVPIDDIRRELGGRLRRAGIPRDLADQLMYKIVSLPAEGTRAFTALSPTVQSHAFNRQTAPFSTAA